MADRKVLIKYYPPDFDPDKLAQKRHELFTSCSKKRRVGAPKLMNVRFMFPFTMCCGMCNEFIYIGTKFNSRVEKLKGEDYHGIPIWRFYARCPHCRAEIAFKTDPENTEYVLESGGTRTYDSKKDADLAENVLKSRLKEEIAFDSILALEHKTHNTINELQALEQIDELRKLNKRNFDNSELVSKSIQLLNKENFEKTDCSPEEANESKKALEDLKKSRMSALYFSNYTEDSKCTKTKFVLRNKQEGSFLLKNNAFNKLAWRKDLSTKTSLQSLVDGY